MKDFLGLSILSFLLFLSSCSKPAGPKKEFSVSLAGIFSTTSDLQGGMLLKLKNNATQVEQLIPLSTYPFVANLEDGNWDIYLVGFEGPSAWGGDRHCGKAQNLVLTPSVTDIRITVTQANCSVAGEPYISMIQTKVPIPSVAFSPVAFGNVPQTSSPNQNFTITNNSSQVVSVALNGAAPAGYSVSGLTGCSAIPVASTCTVTVGLTDTSSTGNKNANIPLTISDGINSTNVVHAVTAQVVSVATLTISGAATYDFTNVLQGTSKTQTFTVTNTGSYAVSGVAITGVSSPYTASGCSGSLNASASCTLTVDFSPDAAGSNPATISVDYHNGITTVSASKNLEGTGVELSFSGGPSGNATIGGTLSSMVTVTNGANFGTAISIAASGLATPYGFVGGAYPGGGTCGSTLAAGASCTIGISFSPISGGTQSDTLVVDYNGLSSNYGLSVTGISAATLTISGAEPYDFGVVLLGTPQVQAFTVANTGATNATTLAISGVSGAISETNDCTSTLAAAGTCTVNVTYLPNAIANLSEIMSLDYYNGAATTSSTRTIQGQGVTLTVSGDFSGDTPVGGSSDATLTVTNPATSGNASSLNVTNINAPFSFKGGAYPGTGGTCTATLAPGTSCSVVITFMPGAPGAYAPTLGFNFNSTYTKNHTVNGNGVTPASIGISDGPTFDFGMTTVGSSVNHTFTLTNGGGFEATSMNGSAFSTPYNFTGGSYPGTAGTCTTTLAAGASCTVEVQLSPTTFGTFNDDLTINYYNGVAAVNSQRQVTTWSVHTGSFAITHPAAPQWNDYIETPGYVTACNPGTSASCEHGGQYRKFTLASFSNCGPFTYAEDSLGVFDWGCYDFSGSGPVVFEIKGFRPGKGLRDLLNSNSWKSMYFEARQGATPVYRSTSNAWWTNAVVNIDSLDGVEAGAGLPISVPGHLEGRSSSDTTTGPLSVFKTLSTGTVLTVNSNISLGGIVIATPKVSLVTLGNNTLSTTGSSPNCGLSGTVTSPSSKTLVCGGGTVMDFAWLEVRKGSGINTSQTSEYGAYFSDPRFLRVHNTSIENSSNGLKFRYSSASKPSLVTDSRFNRGIFGNSEGLTVYAGSQLPTPLTVQNVVAEGNGYNIHVTNSIDGLKILNSKVINSLTGMGVRLYNTKRVTVLNLVATNNNIGIQIEGTSTLSGENVIAGPILSHNGTGLVLQTTSKNTFLNYTAINNSTHGLHFSSGATSNIFINGVVSGSGSSGIYLLNASNNNNFYKTILAHNNQNLQTGTSLTGNSFTKLATGTMGTTDCALVSAVSINSTSTATGNLNPCPYVDSNSIHLGNEFMGAANSDLKNADNGAISTYSILYTAITDWEKFQNPFRYWGMNNSSSLSPVNSGTQGPCLSGDLCGLWDLRVNNTSTWLLNRSGSITSVNSSFTPGVACPSEVNGANSNYYLTDTMSTPNTFLLNAIEQIQDGSGDDDGLCESNETCLYSPNIGAFQGEGNRQQCTFAGSAIIGVTMLGASSQFGL